MWLLAAICRDLLSHPTCMRWFQDGNILLLKKQESPTATGFAHLYWVFKQ